MFIFILRTSRVALAGLFLVTVVAASAQKAPVPDLRSPNTVLFDGRLVEFRPLNGASTWALLRNGTAKIARLLRGKPVDGRPNLYIVSPGTEKHHDDDPGFDHNLVISSMPERPEGAEFDVYYAIILDPALHDDLRSERDIIMAAQQSFHEPEKFTFADIPGVTPLRVSLSIRSLAELDGFRRADGTLPRVIVVPARMVLRAVVHELPPQDSAPVAASALPKATVPVETRKEAPQSAPTRDLRPPEEKKDF